jgi:hypothetical protein
MNSERGIILAEINLGRAYRRKARSLEWGQKDEDFEAGREHLQDAIHRQDRLGASADMFYRIEAHNEMGCLYRDWVSTLAKKERDSSHLGLYLDEAEKHILKAIALSTEEGHVLARHILQYIDSMDDLARVYYERARLNFPHPEGEPLTIMRSKLDTARGLAEEHLEGWDELKLILGKIHFQSARLALTTKEQDYLEDTARNYALAAGYAEGYSLDAPESHKFVSEASAWLCELEAEEAKGCIQAMYTALNDSGLDSFRLREGVNSIVYHRLGVGWPKKVQEVVSG